MPRLSNQFSLITGAARGIGAAIGQAFVREGARVLFTDIDDAEGQALASRLGQSYARLDVRSEADWDAIAPRLNGLTVLVNNAGITGFEGDPVPHDPEHASLDAWRAVHATNLDGVFLGCRAGINAMRATGRGSIINIGSRSGLVGVPAAAAYASSKAAVRNHTKTVALYCAEQGLNIRCNAILPAAVMTPMWAPMVGEGPERTARMAAFVADTPLKRFAEPEEVAALAVLLASEEAAYMTGSELVIDGGLTAGTLARPERA
ncbi:MAG: SDR family oxidoreductase [Maricaulaceae bacterium]